MRSAAARCHSRPTSGSEPSEAALARIRARRASRRRLRARTPSPSIPVLHRVQGVEHRREVKLPAAGLATLVVGEVDVDDVSGVAAQRGRDRVLLDVHVEHVGHQLDVGEVDSPAQLLGVVERAEQVGLVAVQRLERDHRAAPGRCAGGRRDRRRGAFELRLRPCRIGLDAKGRHQNEHGGAEGIALLERCPQVVAGSASDQFAGVGAIALRVAEADPAQRRDGQTVRVEPLPGGAHVELGGGGELDRRVAGGGDAIDRICRALSRERPFADAQRRARSAPGIHGGNICAATCSQ